MSGGYTPPPVTGDLQIWAQNVVSYLQRTASRLSFKRGDARAVENGIILWDEVKEYPIVSKNGEWRQLVLSDGHYEASITSDVTAALANTGYPLTFTATTSEGITNGTPASRIVFEEAGHYMASFSAQISSTSSSTLSFYFWPKLNGTDAPNSTIVSSLHRSNATTVVSRATTFDVSAGDYIEAYWAVDDDRGYLEATPATAFSPAAPSATIGITRLHG